MKIEKSKKEKSLTPEEILENQDKVATESKEQVDHNSDENAIYDMSRTEGWKIMMKKYRKEVSNLLEPIQHEDIAKVQDLTLIGSMSIARREKIETLKWFVGEVESIKKARKEMERREFEQKEASKSKA